MIPEILQKSKQKIAEICQKYQISELALFGSQVRGDSTAASDFDFLVEFQPTVEVDYFELFDIREELENVVNKKVDLISKRGLKKFVRKQVLAEAEVVYAL